MVEDLDDLQYMDDTDRYMDDAETADDDDNDEDDEPEMYVSNPGIVVSRGGYRTQDTPFGAPDAPPLQESISSGSSATVTREFFLTRERGHAPTPRSNDIPTWQIGPAATANTRRRGFGQQPIVEPSISPAPSDAASNRSTGTNQSNGSTFFRTYVEANAQVRHSVMTPDLVFAEIGHGRGTGPGPSTVLLQGQGHGHGRRAMVLDLTRDRHEAALQSQALEYASYHRNASHPTLPSGSSWPSTSRPSSYDGHSQSEYSGADSRMHPQFAGPPDAWHHMPSSSSHPLGFTPMQVDPSRQHPQTSPTTRELHDSVQFALGGPSSPSAYEGQDVDGRGRSAKRSLRNTFTAAEQYANNFFFGGRGAGGGGGHDGSPSGGLANGDVHSH